MLTRADQLYRESTDGSFREKAVKLVLPLVPLAPGMNGAAGSGESDLVDDCKNKRYMINFLDESTGGQD
jgi:hypothetical protein